VKLINLIALRNCRKLNLIDFQSKVAQAVKAVGFAVDELDHGSIGQNLNPGVIFLRKRKRT
jgi:hypothetical protein